MKKIHLKFKSKTFHPFGNARGFTLIEALVSMVILSVGILGVASSVNSVVRFQNKSNNLTQATMLTTSKIEDFKRAGTDEPTGGTFGFLYMLDDGPNGYLNGYGNPNDRTRTSNDTIGIFDRTWELTVYPATAPPAENFNNAAGQQAINMVDIQVTTTWDDTFGNEQTVVSGTVMHKRRLF